MTTDIDAEDELRSELDNTERLLWAGRPKQGVVFYGIDVFLIPFSILWFGGVLIGFIAVFI